jgi:hypothetical protein
MQPSGNKENTVQINVIGWPSTKTERVLANVRAAVAESGCKSRVNWISDIRNIATMGPVTVPAVIINGRLRYAGRIPSVYEVATWIEETINGDLAA